VDVVKPLGLRDRVKATQARRCRWSSLETARPRDACAVESSTGWGNRRIVNDGALGILGVSFVGSRWSKSEKNLPPRRGSRKVGLTGKRTVKTYQGDLVENAYGEGIAERKAREARLVAEERLPNLRQSN
jgi:hypothetical protein